MKFSSPIRAHQYSIKANPKPTLIADSILLGVIVTLIVLIHVLVLTEYGFTPLLLLVWLLLAPIGAWMLVSVIQCAKNLKKRKK